MWSAASAGDRWEIAARRYRLMNQLSRFFRLQRVPDADIREVTELDTPLSREALAIYEQAFPESEREPLESIAASLKQADPDTAVSHFRVLIDEGAVVGFTYFSSYKEYYLGYLKFIAVRAELRGKRYGPILLKDALRQLRADRRRATGWPYLGLVLEVERPETAENEEERALRERRIRFYQRNGAVVIENLDYVAPPVAPGQQSLPFHLMVLRAVPKYGMQRWLRPKAVTALLVEGYGEDPDSWFVRHALDVRDRARGS
jgi:GNAT superfamily N-acetyltransferase